MKSIETFQTALCKHEMILLKQLISDVARNLSQWPKLDEN